MKRNLLLVVLAVALMGAAHPAWGDDYVVAVPVIGVGTPIAGVPYTITQPGFYYLKKSLSFTGTASAITIDASEVTLDLMGFRLTGPSNQNGNGIYIKNGMNNVEVRNGQIINFNAGIISYLYGSSGNYRFANLKVSNCFHGFMIYPSVHGLIITGCQATGSGASGFYISNASGVVMVQNTATNNNSGFNLVEVNGAVIINNVATNNVWGFALGGYAGNLVDRNASRNNTYNWNNLSGCTTGINTP